MSSNMDDKLLLLFLNLALLSFNTGEPVCTSRFDYEFKVLSKLVELETEQKRLQETVAAKQTCCGMFIYLFLTVLINNHFILYFKMND